MKPLLMLSVSAAALMLLATPSDAASSRQQCYGFTFLGQQFDCGHDAVKGDPTKARHTPEKPREPPGDGDGDGDGDNCPDHDNKDGDSKHDDEGGDEGEGY